jgi:hypothetical protein
MAIRPKPKKQRWLTAADAAALLGVTPDAVRRWAKQGRRGPNGTVVQLRAIYLGRWRFRRRWLREFLEATTAARCPEPTENPPVTLSQAEQYAKDVELARRKLRGES